MSTATSPTKHNCVCVPTVLLPEFVVRGLGSHTVGTMGADLVPMCSLVVLWEALAKCFTDFFVAVLRRSR